MIDNPLWDINKIILQHLINDINQSLAYKSLTMETVCAKSHHSCTLSIFDILLTLKADCFLILFLWLMNQILIHKINLATHVDEQMIFVKHS